MLQRSRRCTSMNGQAHPAPDGGQLVEGLGVRFGSGVRPLWLKRNALALSK